MAGSICLIGCLAVLFPVLVAATDWPQYRGSHHDGISKDTLAMGDGSTSPPRRLWKASVGIGFSSVAVADGRVFTAGNNGVKKGGHDSVYCLDAASGKEVWTFRYPQDLDPKYYEGGPGATPTVSGGMVYMVGRNGLVHALDAATGSVAWSRDISKDPALAIPDWGFNSSVLVEGSTLVINAGFAGVALDKATGRPVWITGKEECGYATPVPFVQDGRRRLAMFAAKHVVAVDPASGTEAWRVPWKTDWNVNATDPVFDGGRMFLSSGYGTGCAAFDLSSSPPRRLWFNKEMRSQMACVIALDGHVYGVDGQGGDKDSRLKCLDLASGAVKWASPKAETGNLAAAGGILLWLTGSGELVFVDAKPDAYRERTRVQVGGGKHWSPPVLANGRIFVRNARGDLVCIEAKLSNNPG